MANMDSGPSLHGLLKHGQYFNINNPNYFGSDGDCAEAVQAAECYMFRCNAYDVPAFRNPMGSEIRFSEVTKYHQEYHQQVEEAYRLLTYDHFGFNSSDSFGSIAYGGSRAAGVGHERAAAISESSSALVRLAATGGMMYNNGTPKSAIRTGKGTNYNSNRSRAHYGGPIWDYLPKGSLYNDVRADIEPPDVPSIFRPGIAPIDPVKGVLLSR